MDFRLQRQSLLERATHVEEEARHAQNAQAHDLMRARAALYREMAEELEEDGLFERRFGSVGFALFSLAIDQCVSTPQQRRRSATLITT